MKTRSDEAPPAPAPAPDDKGAVPTPGTGAKNEAQIIRYPNETSLGGAPALIANNGTIARRSPGTGAAVATLAKSTPCGKIAQNGNAGTLIVWNDPVDGSTMMGWVGNDSFQGSVSPASIKPVIVAKDAGAPAVRDAGPGPSPTPPPPPPSPAPAAQDAGPGPLNESCPVSCPAVNGKCPSGKKNDSGMCRIPCSKDSECPRNVRCQSRGVCSSI